MLEIEKMRCLLKNAEIENIYTDFNTQYNNFSGWQRKSIVLCGLSPYAKKLANTLLEQGIPRNKLLIIDTYENCCGFYKGIRVCNPTVLTNNKKTHNICNNKSTFFIICSNPHISYYANILLSIGKQNVITYHMLCVCDKRYDYSLDRYNSKVFNEVTKHLLQNNGFYLNFFDELADDISKSIMYKWIMYYMTLSTQYCCVESISPPYFGQDILKPEDYRIFVDLGGFDGDTLRDFLSMNIGFDEYWFFEADEDLYKRAAKTSDDLRIRYNNIAIGQIQGTAYFDKTNNLSTTGTLSKEGSTEVKIDTIDNIFSSSVKPTTIKMDIEGGEAGALMGAEQTIRKNRPALMVSAEHRADDIKTLSEIIVRFNAEYKFYIRCCMDSLYTDLTIYAIDKGGYKV